MSQITPLQLVVGVLVAGLVIGLLIGLALRDRRRARLRASFGSEYDRTLGKTGSTRRTEAELVARQRRVALFELRHLTVLQRENFIRDWQLVQARFVDDPGGALGHADVLLGEVMVARGYPVEDFEHRAADLSVEHPDVVQNYRAGHQIALRHLSGAATTEEMRQAMIHYRTLFDELVNEPGAVRNPDEPTRYTTVRS